MPAQDLSVILLQDDFDCENGGKPTLNYFNLAHWVITDGSVDLIGNGSFDFLPGNGLYLDLDGSTFNAATMESRATFDLQPAAVYELRFTIAGSRRGDVNTMTVRLGDVYSERFTIPSDFPITTILREIPVAEATLGKLVFDHEGGDRLGILLLDVAFGLNLPEPDPLNRQPTADAGPNLQFDAGDQCQLAVTLDGGASSDPDGDPLTYAWSGPFGTVAGPTPTVVLPPGTHRITLTVQDDRGGVSCPDTLFVTVRESIPPELRVTLSESVLWPPDHTLREVTAAIEARDNCDPSPRIVLVSVTSNEESDGLADGNTEPDIAGASIGIDDRTFSLRAERSGLGSGRVYTARYRASDTSGNVTFAIVEALVPIMLRP